MKKNTTTWSVSDFSAAMTNAVLGSASPKFIKKGDDKISFNGFWRGGDKQNVYVRLKKATWYDAKTGDRGGCKEFAKTVFNMGLGDFMKRYGPISSEPVRKINLAPTIKYEQSKFIKPVNDIWLQLQKGDALKKDLAAEWLINQRGFQSPRQILGCGFVNLSESDALLFEPQHQNFIIHRAKLAPQIIVPLRSTKSDEVRNLFFRTIINTSKEEKSRLLSNVGGWHEPDGSLRAFGFPHLIPDFSHLILCEGMADYLAVEHLLDCNEKFLPIGASNADGISKWAHHLTNTGYKGSITILHQLDIDEKGELNTKRIGPSKAIQALRYFKENQISAKLFDWPFYLKNTTTHPSRITDIADSLSVENTFKECSLSHLQEIFLITITKDTGA